jgi:hypothetical protein
MGYVRTSGWWRAYAEWAAGHGGLRVGVPRAKLFLAFWHGGPVINPNLARVGNVTDLQTLPLGALLLSFPMLQRMQVSEMEAGQLLHSWQFECLARESDWIRRVTFATRKVE